MVRPKSFSAESMSTRTLQTINLTTLAYIQLLLTRNKIIASRKDHQDQYSAGFSSHSDSIKSTQNALYAWRHLQRMQWWLPYPVIVVTTSTVSVFSSGVKTRVTAPSAESLTRWARSDDSIGVSLSHTRLSNKKMAVKSLLAGLQILNKMAKKVTNSPQWSYDIKLYMKLFICFHKFVFIPSINFKFQLF